MFNTTTKDPNHHQTVWIALIGFTALALMASNANGQGVDGFTEPFKRIELSSDESGAIVKLHYEAGDQIKQGDIIARLDDRAQELQLEIANHLASTTSQLVAAEKSLQKRQSILSRLRSLEAKGHASDSEVIRAEMELAIAEAKLLSAKEERVVRQIERRRAEVQLDRRTIKAPFDGVIAKVHRREGEFLSPLHPEIVSVVQVNRLLASFAVPSSQVSMFKPGTQFNISLGNGKIVEARVYRVGVETDAQSSTVEIKMVIENQELKYRSGDSCTLKI